MEEKADLPSVQVLRLVWEARYAGGKAFSQHDFVRVDVEFPAGSGRRLHFFALRLKYSHWVRVSLSPA